MESLQTIMLTAEATGAIVQSTDGNGPASINLKITDKKWDQNANRYVKYPIWVTVYMLPKTGLALAKYIGPGVALAVKARFIRNTWNYAGADADCQPAVLLADELRIIFPPNER